MDLLGVLLNAVVVLAALVLIIGAVRTAISPRLHILDFEGGPEDLRKSLPRLVAAELEIMRQEGAGTSLRFMTGPDQPIEIPQEVIALSTPLSALVQLATLLWRRHLTLTAHMHAPGPRGCGLTVVLGGGGTVKRAATVWEDEFWPAGTFTSSVTGGNRPVNGEPLAKDSAPGSNNPGSNNVGGAAAENEDTNGATGGGSTSSQPDTIDSYRRLALVAATWLAYQVPQRSQAGAVGFLTTSWESYARFRLGAEWHREQQLRQARFGYISALDVDPHNRGALFNLASLDIYARCNGPAIERLAAVCHLLNPSGGAEPTLPLDRLWYRARFNLAVACLHARLDEDRPHECAPRYSAGELHQLGTAALRELNAGCKAALDRLGAAPERTLAPITSSTFVPFVRTARDAAEVVQTSFGQLGSP